MTVNASAQPLRPLPLADEVSEPFWRAAKEHRLAIQRCRSCRRWNHAPTLLCPACGSSDMGFEPVSGRGRLTTWTVIQDPPAPGFAAMLPLIVGIVELEEQDGLLLAANIFGCDPGELRLDLPLEAQFEDVADDVSLPQFRARRS